MDQVQDDWRARASRMGRTTAKLRDGHMPMSKSGP